MVGHGVDHGASGSRVAFLGRHVFWPLSVVPGCSRRNDMAGFVGGENQVEQKELKVPCKDECIDKRFSEFLFEPHDDDDDDGDGGSGGEEGRRARR